MQIQLREVACSQLHEDISFHISVNKTLIKSEVIINKH